MMVRQFRLINAKGDALNFNDMDTFAATPTGLGISFSNEYYQLGTNFIPAGQVLNQGKFQVQLIIGAESGDPYRVFQRIITFLNEAPYQLAYDIDTGSYLRDCELAELTKSEIGEWQVFSEPLTLEFTTPWYKNITSSKREYVDQLGDGKIYGVKTNTLSDPAKNWILNADFSDGWNHWQADTSDPQHILLSEEKAIGNNRVMAIQMAGVDGEVTVIHGELDNTSFLVGDTLLFSFYVKLDSSSGSYKNQVGSYQWQGTDGTLLAPQWDNYRGAFPSSPESRIPKASFFTDGINTWKQVRAIYQVASLASLPKTFTISFDMPANHYFTAPVVQKVEQAPSEQGYYTYEYVYEEPKTSNANPNYFNITNASQNMGLLSGAPTVITIEAKTSMSNPSWQLFQESEVIQSDRFFLDMSAGTKLVVSSFPQHQFARLYQPDGSYANVYGAQDLTKTNFITLPEGASTLIFDVDESASVQVTYREERLIV